MCGGAEFYDFQKAINVRLEQETSLKKDFHLKLLS